MNCKELGYYVGDRFLVCHDGSPELTTLFSNGSIIELYEDDWTNIPLFKLVEGTTDFNDADGELGAFMSLKYVRKIDK